MYCYPEGIIYARQLLVRTYLWRILYVQIKTQLSRINVMSSSRYVQTFISNVVLTSPSDLLLAKKTSMFLLAEEMSLNMNYFNKYMLKADPLARAHKFKGKLRKLDIELPIYTTY